MYGIVYLKAVCVCAVEGTLCGSDGMTYDNICQLTATAVKMGSKITVQNKGPCKSGKYLHICSGCNLVWILS